MLRESCARCETPERHYDVQVSFIAEGDIEPAPQLVALSLFRIAQEALRMRLDTDMPAARPWCSLDVTTTSCHWLPMTVQDLTSLVFDTTPGWAWSAWRSVPGWSKVT